MKTLNVQISDEVHRILVNYKLDNQLKTLDEVVETIVKKEKKK